MVDPWAFKSKLVGMSDLPLYEPALGALVLVALVTVLSVISTACHLKTTWQILCSTVWMKTGKISLKMIIGLSIYKLRTLLFLIWFFFLNLTMFHIFSIFQTFSMFFWKMKAKMTQSQLFFKCFQTYLCFLLHKFLKTLRKKLGHFCHDFSKNIEKVWNIEKISNIPKFRKMETKNDKSPNIFLCPM